MTSLVTVYPMLTWDMSWFTAFLQCFGGPQYQVPIKAQTNSQAPGAGGPSMQPYFGEPLKFLSTAEFERLLEKPAQRNCHLYPPRIVEEIFPHDLHNWHELDTFYRVQQRTQTTHFEQYGEHCHYSSVDYIRSYGISQSQIVNTSAGLEALEQWLGLRSDYPQDQRQAQLINKLLGKYQETYSNLWKLAKDKGGLAQDTHDWYSGKFRELHKIRLKDETIILDGFLEAA